jgi:hypothetical protein
VNDENEDPYANIPSHEDCGLVFGTIYALHRHIQILCIGQSTFKQMREDDVDDENLINKNAK